LFALSAGEGHPTQLGRELARWENEGGKVERLPRHNESADSQFSLELVKNGDGTEAILYTYRSGPTGASIV
jgi:hypothetical protein